MKNFASTRQRYLRDPIPVRLGGLAADLARIGSAAVNPVNRGVVQVLLQVSRRFVEWTAEAFDVPVAGEPIELQHSSIITAERRSTLATAAAVI